MKITPIIRKLTATFLSMVMVVIILPFSASAATSGTGWTLNDGKLIISSDAGMQDWITSRYVSNYMSVNSIEIESGVTSIGDSAFVYCLNLTSITIPNSVTSICDSAFAYCPSLESVSFEESSKLASIGKAAFGGCIRIKIIAIPPAVTSIGNYAFYGCTSLESIIIPLAVTSIGDSTFDGCASLITLEFRGAIPPTYGQDLFDFSVISKIYVPYGTKAAYTTALTGILPSNVVVVERTSSNDNPTTGEKIIPFGVILMIATGAIVITNKKAKQS